MKIRSRLSTSTDGYVTTPDGWPALLADPSFVPGASHGIREFLEGCGDLERFKQLLESRGEE